MIELLSPAGEYNSFLGAINAGADAVYLAGNMYGARASAVNFTTEELTRAIEYAHLFNRKVYLTVNTLVTDNELSKMYDFIRPLYLSGLDACIVQDIGVFKYLKESFPGMDIHSSTQALITSVEGALFYKNLGASRVVLARELTLDEIKDITSLDIETECFIHGAMCYSYSGACLFSSFLGGNSGNRGRCKGPCRQPYTIDKKEEYVLSLKDMCTIDCIDKLIDAKITSFKIEGRLKSPSYAAGVTSVYRKYIDKYLENPGKPLSVSDEDRFLLNNLYSRSGSQSGYYFRTSSKNMITLNGGSYNKVDETTEKIIHDIYIEKPLKIDISMTFLCKIGEIPSLKVKTIDTNTECVVNGDTKIVEPLKQPTLMDDIVKHLMKTGNTVFNPVSIKVECDNGFVPASLVNNMRRESLDKLYSLICANIREDDSADKYESKKISDKSIGYRRAFVDNVSQLEALLQCDFYDSLVLSENIYSKNDFASLLKNTSKKIYLEMPAVLRKQNKDSVSEYLKLLREDYISGCYVNQIDFLPLLDEYRGRKEIFGNFNVYAYNSKSLEALDEYFDGLCAPIESEFKNICKYDCKKFEILMYGRVPLMQTANCILKTKDMCTKYSDKEKESFIGITDRIKVEFPVKVHCDSKLCYNTIYNSKPNSLHKFYDCIKNEGFNCFSFRFTNESSADALRITEYFELIFNGEKKEPFYEFTNGHFKNSAL